MVIGFQGPFLILAFLIWLCLVIAFKRKSNKSNTYVFFFSIFFIYLCYVVKYTQFPIIITEVMKNEGQNVWRDANFIPFAPIHFDIKTSVLNILLTVPFGFGYPFVAKGSLKKIALLGLLLTLTIETLQLIIALIVGYTFRYIDINDIIFNFVGVLVGYGGFRLFKVIFNTLVHKLEIKFNPILKYIYDTK